MARYEPTSHKDATRLLTKITFCVFLVLFAGFFMVKATPSITGFAVATAGSVNQIDDNIETVRHSEFRIPVKLSIFAIFATTVCILAMHFERKEYGL